MTSHCLQIYFWKRGLDETHRPVTMTRLILGSRLWQFCNARRSLWLFLRLQVDINYINFFVTTYTLKHMLQVPYANPIVSQYIENLEKTHWEAVKGLLILISLVTTLGGDLDSVCVCLISFLLWLVGKLFCRLQLFFCLLRQNTCLLLKLWRRQCG